MLREDISITYKENTFDEYLKENPTYGDTQLILRKKEILFSERMTIQSDNFRRRMEDKICKFKIMMEEWVNRVTKEDFIEFVKKNKDANNQFAKKMEEEINEFTGKIEEFSNREIRREEMKRESEMSSFRVEAAMMHYKRNVLWITPFIPSTSRQIQDHDRSWQRRKERLYWR